MKKYSLNPLVSAFLVEEMKSSFFFFLIETDIQDHISHMKWIKWKTWRKKTTNVILFSLLCVCGIRQDPIYRVIKILCQSKWRHEEMFKCDGYDYLLCDLRLIWHPFLIWQCEQWHCPRKKVLLCEQFLTTFFCCKKHCFHWPERRNKGVKQYFMGNSMIKIWILLKIIIENRKYIFDKNVKIFW